MSVSNYQEFSLQWMQRNEDDVLFRKIYRIVLSVCVLLGLLVAIIDVPKPEKKEREPLPPRLVKFLEQKKKTPVAKPVVKAPVKDKQIKRPRPKPKKPLTTDQTKAREKAKKSGLLALSNELSDLMETPAISDLINSRALDSGTKAASNDNLNLSASLTRGSGGVSTKGLDRSVSSTAIGSRQTTRVKSSAAAATVKSEKAQKNKQKTRTTEEITIVMDKNKGSIYAIYNRELRRNPGLEGRVVLEITIAPSGRVTKVKIVSSELKDKKLERKLLSRIKLFNFGKKKVETVTVTYPLEFYPS
ncbi:MAG: TonB family protein [Gammaproteobacteria bacterium]|nr:TonB family protein [Gammaproteobacteria bacterium]